MQKPKNYNKFPHRYINLKIIINFLIDKYLVRIFNLIFKVMDLNK